MKWWNLCECFQTCPEFHVWVLTHTRPGRLSWRMLQIHYINEIINLARHVLEVWRSVQAGSNSVACTVKGEALTVRTWRISLIAIYLEVKYYRWHSDAKTSFEYSSTAKWDSVERQLLIRALPLTGGDARAAHERMTEDLASLRAVDVDQR